MELTSTGTYKIRPAGRLVLTIGRDLIQDSFAAVVELVKNAYDADSADVHIEFTRLKGRRKYSIVVSDHGHGMTREDVINKWMVPSTTDKVRRHRSPSGRVMQGRKGVGRYAASILGTDLFLETVTESGEKTEAFIDWTEFENSEYLDDVDVIIDSSTVGEPPGTRLTITGDVSLLAEWTTTEFEKLRFELKRLKAPLQATPVDEDFQIRLTVAGLPGILDFDEIVEPFPIMELFDYRISGTVGVNGRGRFHYEMQKIRNARTENIDYNYGRPSKCGEVHIDIRVYDRESSSLNSLIRRGVGLTDSQGNYLAQLQARQLLNQYNGIGVYRHGFRIRPLGDPDFDWLKLNEQRVQQPSLRIGSNQVIGFVHIQSEAESGLVEKSARDGLKDNQAFQNLKRVTQEIINQLENRRFRYRRSSDRSKPTARVERQLARLFSSDDLKQGVTSTLDKAGVASEATQNILKLITEDEVERNRVAEDIRRAVAVYQGQATLGKIINVILHEGRRPLGYFRNQIPNLRYWYRSFEETRDRTILHRILGIASGIGSNAEFLVDLFSRIEPLGERRMSGKSPVNLLSTITNTVDVFRIELEAHDISTCVECEEDVTYDAWPQDIYVIFTNLIDNSIYWMVAKESDDKLIKIRVVTQGKALLYIEYTDTGPGIDPSLIESHVIFEPEFSTKPGGTGLGLAIAGEAAGRIDLELSALQSDTGAWFQLRPFGRNEDVNS